MKEIKHTPGPWSNKPLGNTQYHSIDAPEWEVLAKVNTIMAGESKQDREGVANAHLIAAAPELYDVLHRLALYHGPGSCPEDIFEDMQNALTKAEGGKQ